jgi:hypothetical protein
MKVSSTECYFGIIDDEDRRGDDGKNDTKGQEPLSDDINGYGANLMTKQIEKLLRFEYYENQLSPFGCLLRFWINFR